MIETIFYWWAGLCFAKHALSVIVEIVTTPKQ